MSQGILILETSAIWPANLALCVPVMALCIWQLHAVGKVRAHETASLATFMAIAIVGSWVGIHWGARKLRPEEKRLMALVAELG